MQNARQQKRQWLILSGVMGTLGTDGLSGEEGAVDLPAPLLSPHYLRPGRHHLSVRLW